MKKPDNWDKVEEARHGDADVQPDPGPYVCRIVNALETTSKNGRPMLRLDIDIAEGDFAGFFQEDFDYRRDRGWDAWWKLSICQITDGNSTPFFKHLIKTIERANGDFVFNFDEKTLVGKLIGVMLDGEEARTQNGVKYMRLRTGRFMHPELVRMSKAGKPKIKTLDGDSSDASKGGLEHVDDADIPF